VTDFYLLGYNPGTPQFTFPRRGGNKLSGTCIVHTAECATDTVGEDSSAEDTARFIANRADYGSYHTLVDSDSIIEMVPYEYEAWQDSETNNWAVGISAACRTTDWGTMPADREERYYRNLAWAAADFVKYMREVYGIEVPRVRITGDQARNRVAGFCAHGDSGISRTDPGVKFDWARFFNYVNQELEGTVEEVATPEQIAAAVWGYNNGSDRDAYQHLRDIHAADRMTNMYGTELSVNEQIAWIDKNLNDARDLLLANITGNKAEVNIELSPEQITALADSLKDKLAPGVAADLAKRLAE
jgi:hypothetical protein